MARQPTEQRRKPFGKLLFITGALVALMSMLFVACGGSDSKKTPTSTPVGPTPTASSASVCPPTGAATSLSGAGATFPAPLYTKWVDVFKTKCGVEINYQAIGSGGGITNITNQTVDFGASDAILTAEQEQAAVAAGGPILHIPMTIGGIAVVFKLPGFTSGQLKLTPDVLAKIYLGDIEKWNDPAIAAVNAGLSLPDTDITVVHRSDGSGTTFQFTDYLSKVSTDWQSQVGSATTVNWPVGVGGEKNAGVAAQVDALPGAIGYVEVAYAVQANMVWAALQNKSGAFVEPTLAAISAAADGVVLPDDMKVFIDNSDNAAAYPIAGFTWVLAYQNQTDQAKAQSLVYYLWWSIHDGQQYSEALTYATMPAGAVSKAEALIESITYNGQPVFQMP